MKRSQSAQRPSGCMAHCAALLVGGRNPVKMQRRTSDRSDLWGILRPWGLWASMRCPVWTATRLTGGLHRRSGVILDCSSARFTGDGLSFWQEKILAKCLPAASWQVSRRQSNDVCSTSRPHGLWASMRHLVCRCSEQRLVC